MGYFIRIIKNKTLFIVIETHNLDNLITIGIYLQPIL